MSARVLSILLLLTFGAGMGATCPDTALRAYASHGAHAHGGAMPCHEESASADLRAPCPCGCSEGARAPRAPVGLEPGFLSAGAILRLPLVLPPPASPTPALPAPPVIRIDHVPLAA